jgi:hypothetical protein
MIVQLIEFRKDINEDYLKSVSVGLERLVERCLRLLFELEGKECLENLRDLCSDIIEELEPKQLPERRGQPRR